MPQHDRQQALSLFLELALQRGTLTAMLKSVLLLLSLEQKGRGCVLKEGDMASNDERESDNEEMKDNDWGGQGLLSASLRKFLQRLSLVEASKDMVYQDIEDSPHHVCVCMYVHVCGGCMYVGGACVRVHVWGVHVWGCMCRAAYRIRG